jgi:hypothetical protein
LTQPRIGARSGVDLHLRNKRSTQFVANFDQLFGTSIKELRSRLAIE